MDVTGNVIRGNEKQKQSKTMLYVRWPFSLGSWLFPPRGASRNSCHRAWGLWSTELDDDYNKYMTLRWSPVTFVVMLMQFLTEGAWQKAFYKLHRLNLHRALKLLKEKNKALQWQHSGICKWTLGHPEHVTFGQIA